MGISSCTPQESNSICKNTQGEISLAITDKALKKNLAQIESALENSFSAHMPEALNISGLYRLDLTEIELKGNDFVLRGKITPIASSSTESPSEGINIISTTSKQGKSPKGAKSKEKYYKNSYNSESSTNTSTILPTYTATNTYSISSSSSNDYSSKSDKSKTNTSTILPTYTATNTYSISSSSSNDYSSKSDKSKKGKERR